MPRPYTGPKLWLDPRRGTWTITDGRKRVRTGFTESQRDQAVIAVHQYSNGTYTPDRPVAPKRTYAVQPRRGVYVVGFGGYVKIGISTNVAERMATLQTSLPEKLELYAIVDGWAAEESALHRRFAQYHATGEWFWNRGELADWIAEVGSKLQDC